jgi:hypothetical protein
LEEVKTEEKRDLKSESMRENMMIGRNNKNDKLNKNDMNGDGNEVILEVVDEREVELGWDGKVEVS